MSEKRFKVDYEVGVLDTLTNEIVTDCQNAEEVVALLNSLNDENEQLRQQLQEKQEEEQLYANEILELREANKEFIQFKSLGGDY